MIRLIGADPASLHGPAAQGEVVFVIGSLIRRERLPAQGDERDGQERDEGGDEGAAAAKACVFHGEPPASRAASWRFTAAAMAIGRIAV